MISKLKIPFAVNYNFKLLFSFAADHTCVPSDMQQKHNNDITLVNLQYALN